MKKVMSWVNIKDFTTILKDQDKVSVLEGKKEQTITLGM